MKTVIIAAKINNTVAARERIENLLIPHTPCPLVHPLPILVPIPTNNPPKIMIGIDDVIKKGIEAPENIIKINGPNIKPNKNNKFVMRFWDVVSVLLTIPLTPANLPLETKKSITAIPISKPPIKAVKGEKFTVSMISIIYI